MYIHPKHRLTDPDALHALIATHPLGTWVCLGQDGLVANHLPFHLDRGRGSAGTLVAHVARANPVWRELDGVRPCVVTFQGPQAYITPGWYPGKATHGEVVPTWNYVVAHAHGVARVIEGREALLATLHRLTDDHESHRAQPWFVDDASAAFIDRMLRGIVGVEIPIDRLEGKLKASQDEALEDRLGAVAGLRASGCAQAKAMADLIERAIGGQA